MLLESTDDLEVIITAPVITNNVTMICSYYLIDRKLTDGNTYFNFIGDLDGLSGPIILTPQKQETRKRIVEAIVFHNKDTVNCGVQFAIVNGSGTKVIYECVLYPQEAVQYSYPQGFTRLGPTDDTLVQILGAINTLAATAGTIILTAGEIINGDKVVMEKLSGAYKNDPTDVSTSYHCVGFAASAVSPGDPLVVITSGNHISAGWGLTPDAIYWADANGGVTSTPPSAPGLSQCVGIAVDANTMFVAINEPVELV